MIREISRDKKDTFYLWMPLKRIIFLIRKHKNEFQNWLRLQD